MFLQYLDKFYFPFSIDRYGFKAFTPIFIIVLTLTVPSEISGHRFSFLKCLL